MTPPTPLLRDAIVSGLLSLLLLLPIMMNMGDGVVVVAFSSSECFSVKKQHPPWGACDIVSPPASPTARATLLGSTRILSKRNRQYPLYSSRGRRTIDDYYYEEDDDEKEEDEDISDSISYPRPRSDKSSKMNRVAPRKRRDVRVEDTNEVDDFDDNEEMEDEFPLDGDDEEIDDDSVDFLEDREDTRISSTRRSSRRRSRTDYDDDNEDYWDDDDEYFDDSEMDSAASAGNFWSNPKGSLDRPPRDLRRPRLADIPQRRERVQREYDGRPDYYVNDSRRTARRGPAWRSPVRVGAPPPNQFLEQLYDKVFFYGFDLDENDDRNVGDKSVFGGTKGKFNGLKYLAISEGRDPSIYSKRRQRDPNGARPGRRLPPSRSGESEEDYYEDDYLSERSYPSPEARSRYSRRVERGRRSSGRVDRPREEGFMDSFGFANGRDRNDRVSKQVSTWFTDEDGDDFDLDDDQYDNGSMERRSRSGQRGRRQQSEWSPVGMLESFLRLDRDQMDFKAAEYDSKMGIRRPRSRRSRGSTGRPDTEKSTQEKVQRPGYAYRYDASLDDDDSPTVLDIDATVDIEEELEADQKIDAEPTAEGEPDNAPRKKSDKSWEERQAAVERVPPADVPAWGPKGQLPINARQKAIEDALKDIQLAKRKLNDRVKKEIRARDEIAILNVDSKALRLKMDQSRRGRSSQLDVEQLRQIELEIDDASRALRRSRNRVDIAREELEELEDRHYAVMSYYDPDQASKLVGDALDELSGQVGPSASGTLERNESGAQTDS